MVLSATSSAVRRVIAASRFLGGFAFTAMLFGPSNYFVVVTLQRRKVVLNRPLFLRAFLCRRDLYVCDPWDGGSALVLQVTVTVGNKPLERVSIVVPHSLCLTERFVIDLKKI
jgi:hypothetical protein